MTKDEFEKIVARAKTRIYLPNVYMGIPNDPEIEGDYERFGQHATLYHYGGFKCWNLLRGDQVKSIRKI